ncbi:MAG: SGNH/GDSL hydrolase family protein [Deltaproteobacteria bacterium]|nr:SGNH/GDSL hydrolase family protein [Deltaproteobacteria bacterium]
MLHSYGSAVWTRLLLTAVLCASSAWGCGTADTGPFEGVGGEAGSAEEDEAGEHAAQDPDTTVDPANISDAGGGGGSHSDAGASSPDPGKMPMLPPDAASPTEISWLGHLPTGRAIRIQPLGDSITEGKASAQEATYRRPLWKKLIAANYNVDFVGTRNVQLGDAKPFYNDYDPDHEGHYGWKLSQVLPQIDAWLASYAPDVSLVHLGTNDQSGASGAEILAMTETLIGKLRKKNPNIVIFVAQLIAPNASGRAFNASLPGLAARITSEASPVIVVDQTTGFDWHPGIDTIDGIHPNPAGQEKMAAKWYMGLVKVLPK